MSDSIVVMGVAGCGKSSLALAVSHALGCPLVEGDAHHSDVNLARMAQGIALTDADRQGWLAVLASILQAQTGRAVLTCSALKCAYRGTLRAASPGLRFVFLDITRDAAVERVLARASEHFFSVTLVDSQFATLEPPSGEPGVLRLDASLPPDQLKQAVLDWLQLTETL